MVGLKIWIRTILFCWSLFLVFSIYEFFSLHSFTLLTISKTISDVAFVLIGLALGLSSFCYFFSRVCSFEVYRKYLGLSGYICILVSGTLALLFLPESSPFKPYSFPSFPLIPFLITLPSLLIYSLMTLVSNTVAIRLLGGRRWRMILRLGFVAYYLSTLHFTLRYAPEWFEWIDKPAILPPISFFLVIFGLTILIFRIIMSITLLNSSKRK